MSKISFKLSEISEFLGGKLFGDGSNTVFEINSLKDAQKGSISFIYNKKFTKDLKNTKASAVILSKEYEEYCNTDYIVLSNPHAAYAKLTQLFSQEIRKTLPEKQNLNQDYKNNIQIEKNVFVGKNVKFGKGVIINSGCFIGDNCEIGTESYLHPNTCIYHSTILGKKNIIHANSVIGSDGLGFAKKDNSWEKIEHLGIVKIEDNVEIGASCTIDRGSLGMTLIGKGVKLDNQVHIAHNCKIGKNTIIGAKTAIAGSTVIGEDCLIGGGCGIVDNIMIENKVRINPMTYVTKSIKKSGIYSGGAVVLEHSNWLKHITIQKKQFDD